MFAHMHTHTHTYTGAECIQYSLCSRLSLNVWEFPSFFVSFCQAAPPFFFFLSLKSQTSQTHTHTCRESLTLTHTHTQAYFHIADNHILLINSFHSFFRLLSAVISALLSSHILQKSLFDFFFFLGCVCVECHTGLGWGNKLCAHVSGDLTGLRNQTQSKNTPVCCFFWGGGGAVCDLLCGFLLLYFQLVPDMLCSDYSSLWIHKSMLRGGSKV